MQFAGQFGNGWYVNYCDEDNKCKVFIRLALTSGIQNLRLKLFVPPYSSGMERKVELVYCNTIDILDCVPSDIWFSRLYQSNKSWRCTSMDSVQLIQML